MAKVFKYLQSRNFNVDTPAAAAAGTTRNGFKGTSTIATETETTTTIKATTQATKTYKTTTTTTKGHTAILKRKRKRQHTTYSTSNANHKILQNYDKLPITPSSDSSTNYVYAHVAATSSTNISATAAATTLSNAATQNTLPLLLLLSSSTKQLTTYAQFVAQHFRYVALHLATTTFCVASALRCNSLLKIIMTSNKLQTKQAKVTEKKMDHVVPILRRNNVRGSTATTSCKSFSSKTLQKLLLQLSIGSHLDTRSLFYLLLIVLCYWYVLMHASTAAASVPTTSPLMPMIIEITTIDTDTAINLHAANSSASVFVSAMPKASAKSLNNVKRRRVIRRDVANVPEEEYDTSYPEDIDDIEALINNKSAKGKYIGAPCNELKCDANLLHVSCDKETLTCSCEKNYPVQLGPIKGCAKPKKLGEQCFYDETCIYNDENALCVQVRHNALCQCANGFHSVSYTKPTRRVFCTEDLSELSSDLPTLLGVSTGIAVLAGLICMVLHLFTKTKYPRHRNFGDANIPPPILYSNETGIPLTVHSGRPSSRSSIRSTGSIGSYGNRRASTGGGLPGISGTAGGGGSSGPGGSKGILVSTSRTGSRRPSLASVHSTSSSVRSYSMMRFEKEVQQKEIRQEMKLRLARLHQQQQLNQNKPQIIIGETFNMQHGALSRITMVTPSPLTPNSLDELLPSVDETQEYPIKLEAASTSRQHQHQYQQQHQLQQTTKVNVAAATISAIKHVAAAPNIATTSSSSAASILSSGAAALATTTSETELGASAAAYIGPCTTSTEAL